MSHKEDESSMRLIPKISESHDEGDSKLYSWPNQVKVYCGLQPKLQDEQFFQDRQARRIEVNMIKYMNW